MVWLLARYSDSYASNQYRALQQFFKWWAGKEELPDPMARLRPPKVTGKLVPVFTSVELSKLERACQGRSFAQRRDAAIIATFRATGIRLSELAGIRYHADDTERSDLDLWQREITVRGKNGKARIVKIDYQTARTLDRYLRIRSPARAGPAGTAVAGRQNRGPMTANGIYQMIVRAGGNAAWMSGRTGSGTISATPGWTAAAPKATSWS
jgi:integrase/recombinase XerD